MNDSSYPDESNLLDRNVSDNVDPTISADALTWPNYVQLWINVTTGALGCCANGIVLFLLLAAKKLRVHPSYFLIKFQILLDFTACVLLTISYSLELVRNGNAEVMRKWGTRFASCSSVMASCTLCCTPRQPTWWSSPWKDISRLSIRSSIATFFAGMLTF